MIEKNQVSPSVSSLKKVLSGLPMSMIEFFSLSEEEKIGNTIVYKNNQVESISSGSVVMKLIGTNYQNRLMTLLDEIYPAYSDTGDSLYSHKGEEAGIVIAGKLKLKIEKKEFLLETGDSYYFDSKRLHGFFNPFSTDARLISVTTPANF